jgi:hypothetical protein
MSLLLICASFKSRPHNATGGGFVNAKSKRPCWGVLHTCAERDLHRSALVQEHFVHRVFAWTGHKDHQ